MPQLRGNELRSEISDRVEESFEIHGFFELGGKAVVKSRRSGPPGRSRSTKAAAQAGNVANTPPRTPYALKETTTTRGVDDLFGDSQDINLPAPEVRAV